MEDHDDFQGPEPVRGLPERPPEGEKVLWQGSPDWWALARDAMSVHWIAVYFAFLALWRGIAGWMTVDLERGIGAVVVLLLMGAVACGLVMLFAYIQARATVYTVTNKRVVMRIGAALVVTLNLPYRWIGAADLKLGRGGTGTIAFDLLGETRFSHVRPWQMKKTQPAFRAIPEAEKVATIIAEHARAAVTAPAPSRARPAALPTPANIPAE